MTSTPSISTVTNEPEAAVELAGQGASSVGMQSVSPGECESPAETDSASAQASMMDASSLFIVGSPVELVEGGGGFASAKAAQVITQPDPDLVLYCSLADRKAFDEVIRLCLERLHFARDPDTSTRWNKDLAIAEALQGHYPAAYKLLASAEYVASLASEGVRGKYENEFGIASARTGRTSLSLDHYDLAERLSRKAGDLLNCARVDHNRARALMARGETAKAREYFTRALDYAYSAHDYRLMNEVTSSLLEFGVSNRPRRCGEE